MCLEGLPDASEVTAAQRTEMRELPWISRLSRPSVPMAAEGAQAAHCAGALHLRTALPVDYGANSAPWCVEC